MPPKLRRTVSMPLKMVFPECISWMDVSLTACFWRSLQIEVLVLLFIIQRKMRGIIMADEKMRSTGQNMSCINI